MSIPGYKNSSFFSKLTFLWAKDYINHINNNSTISPEDLQSLSDEQKTQNIYSQWLKVWNEKKESDSQSKEEILYYSLKETFKDQIRLCVFLEFIQNQLTVMTPILIYFFISQIKEGTMSSQKIIMFIVIGFVGRLVRSIFQYHSSYHVKKLGSKMYAVVTAAILNKSVKVSLHCNPEFKKSQIQKFLHVDCFKLIDFPEKLILLILTVYQQILILIYLYYLTGLSFIAGVLVMGISMTTTMIYRSFFEQQDQKIAEKTNSRIRIIHQIISNIRFIKINALQEFFIKKSQESRSEEVQGRKRKKIIEILPIFLGWVTGQYITVITLAVVVLRDMPFSSALIFTIMSFFNFVYLFYISSFLSYTTETFMNLKRIQEFLMIRDVDISYIKQEASNLSNAIEIQNANFYWQEITEKEKMVTPVLKNINIQIKIGQFIAIIGNVSSGKSSFLSSIIGEMMIDPQNPPRMAVNHSLGIVSQKPWILNDTVKNNIILENQYDHERYIEAVNLACLADDIKMFHSGDMEIIGEKGATVSGGQKMRISLARIFYSNCEIMLLDDILSSLDMHVGKKIFSHALTNRFKNKTRIIATHSLNFLKYTDRIVVMEDGAIKRIASYEELSRENGMLENVPQKQLEEYSNFKKQLNFSVEESKVQQNLNLLNENFEVKKLNILEIYKSYFHFNGGASYIFIYCLNMALFGTTGVFIGVWYNSWGSAKDYRQLKYALVICLILLCRGLFGTTQQLIITFGSIFTRLYSEMAIHLLYAPIHQFFDKVPVARIINRIAKDINHIDTVATSYFIIVTAFAGVLLLWFGFFVITAAHFLLVVVLLIYMLWNFYIVKVNIETLWPLLSLEHNLKSSVISICSQILNGTGQLKAYHKINLFLQKNIVAIDKSRLPLCPKQGVQGWYLSFSRFILIVLKAIFIGVSLLVLKGEPQKMVMFVSSIYFFQETVRRFSKYLIVLTQHLYSVTRCEEIINILPQQGYQHRVFNRGESESSNQLVEEEFPSNLQSLKGNIKFDRVFLRYQEHLPPVLKCFTVEIKAGDKVAVLGKTGSGKSTIFLSFLKFLKPFSGQIEIDGLPLDSIPLQHLRNNMNVIMQDNVIFKGTLRENLDPLSKHSDKYLLQNLQMCNIKNYFVEREGLDTDIDESGSNLSAGQRQILTIIRAILEPKSIVLIDEATANIDADNEKILIDVLNKKFKQSTILSIMHKLDNLHKYKKVMIIADGQVEAFDFYQSLKGRIEQMYHKKK